MSFGIPVRNGLSISLLSTTALSTGRRLIPALNLNFLSGALDPRITFSRGSNATLTDSTGKITYAPTNLVLQSESFDNAAWQKVGGGAALAPTVSANAGAAPDGTTTADRVQFNCVDAASSANRSYISPLTSLTTPIGVRFVASVWVKAFDVSNVGKTIRFTCDGIGNLVHTLTASWQRISISGTSTFATTNFLMETRGTYTTQTADVLLWGAQLEPVTYQTTPGTYNSTTPKNLLGFTQEFDNAAWTKSNTTVTANAFLAPDGTLTADKVSENTATSSHIFYNTSAVSVVSGTSYTVSVYAKAAERSWLQIVPSFSSAGAYFNLATGATGTVTNGTATITAVGNGWYRCSLTFTSNAASGFVFLQIASANGTNNYTGDGTSGIYVWGAQLSDSASLDPYVYNPAAAAASAAYYGPRFDYDPVTLAAKGLLIEEQRTNLLTYSQEIGNAAAWVNSNVTITSNATAAPDGTTTADLLVDPATAAQHYVSQVINVTTGTAYTASFYVKNAGKNQFVFTWSTAASAFPSSAVTYNLLTGAASVVGAGSATITAVGNGWYRCTTTNTATATLTTPQYFSLTGLGSYTGDGVNGVYLWGAQIEAGSFATSYIPTVASQVTRSADVATMIGDNFKSWYNQNAGTFTADFTLDIGVPSANGRVIVVSSLVGPDRVVDLYSTSAWVSYNGTTAISSGVTANTSSTPVKAAAAYAVGDYALGVNGATPGTATSSLLNIPTQIRIGSYPAASNYLNGHIRSIGYYNTRQPNATLQTLTNPSTTPSLALNFISDTYTVGA